jgi:hypothetical protein
VPHLGGFAGDVRDGGDDFDPPLIIQSAFNASLNAAIESAPPISSKLIRRSTDGALVASIISVKVSSF